MSEAPPCRRCGEGGRTVMSDAPGPGENPHGWDPSLGSCFLCYCYALWGGQMEPVLPRFKSIFGINCKSERSPEDLGPEFAEFDDGGDWI